MTTTIKKTKLNKSDEQTNIDKHRVSALLIVKKPEYYFFLNVCKEMMLICRSLCSLLRYA